VISDDGIPVDACPKCGVHLRLRPGQAYCPTGDYVEDLPEVEYPVFDDDIPSIHGG
jgi:hypothetical protein